MAKKQIYKPSELQDSLIRDKDKVFEKGLSTGFKTLDDIISFPIGYHTILHSQPHSGKSVITLDILVGLAERDGKTIAIYSPEFRSPEELLMALIQQKIGKIMYGKHAHKITDKEFLEALNFIDKHFIILDRPERTKANLLNGLTVTDIFLLCKEAEDKYKIKIDFIFVDPLNYISRGTGEKDMSIADYMLHLHDTVAEFSKRLKVHTIISAHCRDLEMIEDKDTGIKYYPVSQPSDIMGGQSHFRGASQIIALWRCPAGVIEKSTGVPYPENAVDVINQKAKPMGSGRLGKVRLHFNPTTHKMCEKIDGNNYQVNEYLDKNKVDNPTNNAIKPNEDFNPPF